MHNSREVRLQFENMLVPNTLQRGLHIVVGVSFGLGYVHWLERSLDKIIGFVSTKTTIQGTAWQEANQVWHVLQRILRTLTLQVPTSA